MKPTTIWKKGDRVGITYLGRTVTGRVELASENGISVCLVFDALLGGYAGRMPVLWNEERGEFRCLILGMPVTLAQPED